MKLLAFETATEACSVALYLDGEVRERFEVAPRRHAELALPWADALLTEAGIARSQLDAIAVGRGPGAFTGVRLAIALAQGIAVALDVPVVPESTLRTLAARALLLPPLRQQGRVGEGLSDRGGTIRNPAQPPPNLPLPSHGEGRILAAIDARMGEIYAAAFRGDGEDIVATSEETVIAPADYALPEQGNDWVGVGSGFAAESGALQARLGPSFIHIDAAALPHAADLARLAVRACERGEAVAAELVEPAYLRNNVALTLQEQKALRAK